MKKNKHISCEEKNVGRIQNLQNKRKINLLKLKKANIYSKIKLEEITAYIEELSKEGTVYGINKKINMKKALKTPSLIYTMSCCVIFSLILLKCVCNN